MPNTKTKKFDWQIFLAVFCILLVICCATVCCVVSNTDKGVARAEDAPSTNLTNLTFETSDNFYIKNLSVATTEEIESYIKYFTNGIEGVLSNSVDFSYTLQVGTYVLTYNLTDTIIGNLYFEVNQISSYGLFAVSCYIQSQTDSSSSSMFDLMYMYTSGAETISFTVMQSSSTDNSKYTYNVPTLNSLSWFSVFGISNVTSVNRIKFNFNYTTNLGCIISPNDTFATVPSTGGYDEGYQEGYDVGYDDGLVAGIEEANTSYSDGYKAALESVKSINLTSNLEYFNRYSYQYLENDLWKQAQTTQINSQVWLNNSSSDYLFTTKYFNLSSLSGLVSATSYKNFTLYAAERHQGGSSLSLTIAVESLSESFSISFYDGSRLTYTLDLSTTYQNGVPVSYGTLPTGYPFTHIVLNYIDSNALFTLDAINQIVITANNFVLDSYNTALDEGFKNGYQQGYSTALELYANNDYSFFTLFTSVFDAPITAIVGKWGDSDGDGVYQREGGMLNFYIPGLDINFAPFLLSLFTIGIIVLIIRFILARKS